MEMWVYLESQGSVVKQGNLVYKAVKVPLDQRYSNSTFRVLRIVSAREILPTVSEKTVMSAYILKMAVV